MKDLIFISTVVFGYYLGVSGVVIDFEAGLAVAKEVLEAGKALVGLGTDVIVPAVEEVLTEVK